MTGFLLERRLLNGRYAREARPALRRVWDNEEHQAISGSLGIRSQVALKHTFWSSS